MGLASTTVDVGRWEGPSRPGLPESAAAGDSDLFDRRPIQGVRLMRALLAELGTPVPLDEDRFTPAGLKQVSASNDRHEQKTVEQLPPNSPMLLVYRYCATCHLDDRQIPPGCAMPSRRAATFTPSP